MTTPLQAITTAAQLLEASGAGRCELVRGELRTMSPAGADHGAIVMELGRRVANHVKDRRLGRAYAAETGFVLTRNPDTVRAPDVAFVAEKRLPATARRGGRGFFEGPPDLAIEVLSPEDRAGEVSAKVEDWLHAGTRAVWVVDPRTRTVTRYQAAGEARTYGEGDTLVGGDVLPGFEIPVAAIFDHES